MISFFLSNLSSKLSIICRVLLGKICLTQEHLSCEERQRELGVIHVQKRRLRVILGIYITVESEVWINNVCTSLKGEGGGAGLPSLGTSNRTWGNGKELHSGCCPVWTLGKCSSLSSGQALEEAPWGSARSTKPDSIQGGSAWCCQSHSSALGSPLRSREPDSMILMNPF